MRTGLLAAAILLLLVASSAAITPGWFERRTQGVVPHDPWPVSEAARALHARLTIVDWHTDTLLWDRDLFEHSDRGHVDVPRLEAGNVAIQMFTAVTKSPDGQNYESNTGDSDRITALVMLQLWPPRTWSSLTERALHQARKLERAAAREPARLRLIRTREDLAAVLAARAAGTGPIGALLGIEGAHALDGDLANLERLYDAGFRMIGLHHFFDNELGGSLHGVSKAGLSEFGRAVVRRLEERGVMIDLSHSSPAVVDEVLAMASRPVVVSHTGMYGTCPSARNLSDAQMKRIAGAGGLVAIGFWEGAVCDISPSGVVRALRHAIDLLGADHVAFGSDFDGATTTLFDASELAVLTQTMLAEGFTAAEIEAVSGGSSLAFLERALPGTTER